MHVAPPYQGGVPSPRGVRVQLVINTSSPQARISLYKDGVPLGEKTWTADQRLGTVLVQQIEGLLRECKITKKELTEIIVNKEGGHWGAVRTGVTVATTLGEALGIPVT